MKCLNGSVKTISISLFSLLVLFLPVSAPCQEITVSSSQLEKLLQQILSLQTSLEICKTQITNGQASIDSLKQSLVQLTKQYQAVQNTAKTLQNLCQTDKTQLATASYLQSQSQIQFDSYKKEAENKIASLERDKWLYGAIGVGAGIGTFLVLHFAAGVIK